MNDAEKQQDIQRLRDAAAILSEHFETVQIFVTKINDNWHAREGQVREWVI